jgi:hypothetical protein
MGSKIDVTILGAGGKVGYRIARNLKDINNYNVLCVEVSNDGIKRLNELSISTVPESEALDKSEIIVLALPDHIIGSMCEKIVPNLKSKAMLIGLDPAAAFAGVMPIRNDISYFVVHPCHPGLFIRQDTPEADLDFFGGTARQDLVAALYHGAEEDYQKAVELSLLMFQPVDKVHRVTIEQMAILEPAMVETVNQTLINAIHIALNEAIKMGVPKEAANAFFWGHVKVQLGIEFGMAGFQPSDGAKIAMENAREIIFKHDWAEKIFNLPAIKESVDRITKNLMRKA